MAAAVEIPVVVNIDKAFEDATRRVDQAMQPFQRKLNSSLSGMKVNVSPLKGYESDLRTLESVLNRVRSSSDSVDYAFRNIQMALRNAKSDLNELYTVASKNGGLTSSQEAYANKLKDAIILLEREIDLRTRAGALASEEASRQIQVAHAIADGNAAMQKEASTMAELNQKISALRARLENIDPVLDKKAWTETAKEIKRATDELAKYDANLKKILAGSSGTAKTGSIDQIRGKMKALMTEWDAMSRKVKFDENGQLSAKAQKLIQQYKELTLESEKYGRSLQDMARKAVPAVESTTQKLRAQSGVVRMLTSYLSIYTAIFASFRFLRNIRETTAEFEMQRVALGGIIQDADKANALFREIKAAAIRSPFQIKDLVKYTKQLSAYRVETENLFKVTQQLADVSAGLGVDMNRLILAYGQVRAAAVLRGQELRQFTEAGIPLVELLAKKFQELGREGTTTADVFELISKRAVPFEMIAEIFDDMTKRGGIFYKMQEKQAETLKGQWTNLRDALSIMYDEIGNTSGVHNAMTGLINDAKFLFNNWRYIANAIKLTVYQMAAFKAVSLFLPNLKRELVLAKKAQDAYTRAQTLSTYAQETGSKTAAKAAVRLRTYAALMDQASLKTNFFTRSWLKLKAVMAGTGWVSILITALSAVATVLLAIRMESGRLNKELRKIGVEGQTSINRSVSNFKRLADAAVNAADGSKEQADAVEELRRTYGDIIPTQDLEVEKLKQLAGNYDNLTRAIREKISEQIREQKVNAITDEYTTKVTRKQKKVKNYLSGYGLDPEQINAVMSELQRAVQEGLISVNSTAYEKRQVFEKIIKELTGFVVDFGNGFRDLSDNWQNVADSGKAENSLLSLTDLYIKMEDAINGVNNSMEQEIGTFGKFAKMARDMEKDIANVYADPNVFGDSSTYSAKQEVIRQKVQVYWDYIKKAFEEAGRSSGHQIDISKALLGDGKIDFAFLDKAVSEAMAGGRNTRLNTFVTSIQQSYEELVPSDKIVNLVREKVKQMAEQFDVPMDKAQLFFKDSEKTMEDWVKGLEEAQKEQDSLVQQMTINNREIENGTKVLEAYSQAEIDAANNLSLFLSALVEFFAAFKKKSGGGSSGYQQDPFIHMMNERIKFMKDFKKGYDDLNKYLSSGDALEKVSENMLSRGLSMGISADDQMRAAKELSDWYEDAMNEAFKQAKTHGAQGSNYMDFLRQVINDKTNKGKALKDFQHLIQDLYDAKTDIDISNMKTEMEKALKQLKEEVKRTEVAQNFMKDIFDLTGDKNLAMDMAVNVYGEPGTDLEENMKKLLSKSFVIDSEKLGEGIEMPNIAKAIDEKDLKTLRKYLQYVVDDNRDAAEEIVSAWEKEDAALMKNFATLISKYGDTAQKVATIRAKAKKEIEEVEKGLALSLADSTLTPEERKALEDRAKEIIKIINANADLDVFKISDDYVRFFSEINVMTAEQAASVRGDLRDAYLKAFHEGAISADELRRNLRAVDEQFKKMTEHTSLLGAYLSGGFEGGTAKLQEFADSLSTIATKMQSGSELNGDEQNFITRMLKQFNGLGDNTKGIKSYTQLMEAFSSKGGAQEAGKALGQMGKGMSAMAAKGPGALAIVDAVFQAVHSTITSIQQMIDELNRMRSEENKVGEWFKYVSDFDKYTYSGWEKLKSGDVIGATADAVSSYISIFNNIQETKVKSINKDIKKQTELLDDLEYTYSRLAHAMEESFGADYIYNFNKQVEVLKAQAEAYRRQAELERSKGKSADEDVAKEYEKSARDVEDKIADSMKNLTEYFAGTDLTAAAESFADAWIEAYKEFGSTTDAISEQFDDMIQSMIKRSLAAKIMQEMLQPLFNQIDQMTKDGLLSTSEIAEVAELAKSRIPMINEAMTGLMTSLASAGLDVRASTAGLSGISKDIAGASEESILGLAAGINTQNFYMSYVPVISENVASILSAMTGGVAGRNNAPAAVGENGDVMPSVQQMVYDHLPNIDQRLANLESLFRSVITGKTSSTNTNCVAIK